MKSAGSLAETPALNWQRRLFTFRSSRTLTFRSSRTHLSVAHPLTRMKYRSFRATSTGQAAKTAPRPGPGLCAACVPTQPQANKLARSELMSVCMNVIKLLTNEHSEDLRRKEAKSLFKTASHALSQLSYGPSLRGCSFKMNRRRLA
jgi:hypothetical protein